MDLSTLFVSILGLGFVVLVVLADVGALGGGTVGETAVAIAMPNRDPRIAWVNQRKREVSGRMDLSWCATDGAGLAAGAGAGSRRGGGASGRYAGSIQAGSSHSRRGSGSCAGSRRGAGRGGESHRHAARSFGCRRGLSLELRQLHLR